MSNAFRELLRKIGSGPHTGKDLTREEAAAATRMMLLQEATPAQIGAFMIAHRIKRPTGEELAGMLDAYEELGPALPPIAADHPVLVMSSPYDGRDRTLPLSLVTALILAAAGCPVVQHGGGRLPTKEGVPLGELWQGLGIQWAGLSLKQSYEMLQRVGIGFVDLVTHFPQAQALVPYREQIGKRPPFATLELMWTPYRGESHTVVGFVHPPTEGMARSAFALRQVHRFTTVKGLEGSCDLPRERTAIIGYSGDPPPGSPPVEEDTTGSGVTEIFYRLHLHPHDYGFSGKNVPLEGVPEAIAQMISVLSGHPSELRQSVLWNSGFYLWRCGLVPSLEGAIALAAAILDQGRAAQKLKQLAEAILHFT